MRKSTAIIGITSVFVAALLAFGWYWASPFYAVAGLRDAAIRGDTKELTERVDFARLREEIRTQFSGLLIGSMADNLRGNPFAAIGVALAAKLTDVMIDAMVTPAGIAALVEPAKNRKPDGVSGWNLMLSSDFAVHREGLNAFDLYSVRERKMTPTLRFNRDGLAWRLVALQLPKEFLAKQMGDAAKGGRPTAPYIPKWEFHESKDPMDDTVSLVLSRAADEEVSARFSSVRPTLIFRCRQNKLDAYINVSRSVEYDYQTHSARVRLRFDDNPAKREKWVVSDDREAFFSPNPAVFFGSLLKATSMQFEWNPLDGGPTVARFTKGDLEAHAARFANGCGKPGLLEQTPQEVISSFIPVGAYASADAVRQLRAMLTKNAIESYTEEIQTKQGKVWRVRAGPFRSMEAAEIAREQMVKLGLRPGDVREKNQGN